MNDPCPTPRKKGYPKLSVALCAADKLAVRFEATPYQCRCGRWHLTTIGGRNHTTRKKPK